MTHAPGFPAASEKYIDKYLILEYATFSFPGSAGYIYCNWLSSWLVRPNKTQLEEEILRFQGLNTGEGSIYCRLIYVWVRVFGWIDNVWTCQIRRNAFQYVYFFLDLTSTNFNWWKNHYFVIVFNKRMAWSQASRDSITDGLGNEAGLIQGSALQAPPSPMLCPGKGSGIHCEWQVWQLQLDFLTRETETSGTLGQKNMSWKQKSNDRATTR